MPRKIDPSKIKVGHGLAASDSVEVNALVPSGTGAAPAGLTTHVQDDHNAHPAHAVSIDNVPETYDASHVEGALDELSALVPPRPPALAKFLTYMDFNTLPDWGILKLNDGPISQRIPSLGLDWDNDIQNNGFDVYPYFWNPFWTMGDTAILEQRVPEGSEVIANNDPNDLDFNVWNATYEGGGPGNAHSGEFRRVVDGEASTQTTHCVIPSSGPSGGKKVVVSGGIYPADRGTLALIRCCPGGELEEICHDVDLLKRCLAAINLGQGILDKCDGDPGGIFTLGAPGGEDAPMSTDPYSFPGRATGQYNLEELHTGEYAHYFLSKLGQELPAPFNDADEDGNKGWNYAGQVRLGTDPNAGMAVIADGIPILGGGSHARGGGHDQNFLAYRLPYMDDYSFSTGLRYTPINERYRFKAKPSVPGGHLSTYGGYHDFDKEYWTWQVARYRHQFTLTDDIILDGEPRESGTYLLIHFKKEEYFEALVRDGVWPTEDQIYSQNLYNPSDVEDPSNKSQLQEGEWGKSVPELGYDALRRLVYEDPKGHLPYEVKSSQFLIPDSTRSWNFHAISGVKYFLGHNISNIRGQFEPRLAVTFHGSEGVSPGHVGFWENSWRNGPEEGAFDRITNECPILLGFGAFTASRSFEEHSEAAYYTALTDSRERFSREHLQVSAADLSSDLADTPAPEDEATVEGTVRFSTVRNTLPKFSTEAAVRIFQRRPLTHLSIEQGASPDIAALDAATHVGYRVPVSEEISGKTDLKLLYHGSSGARNGIYSRYGNFLSGGEPLIRTMTDTKDEEERFLDEVYRWRSDFRTTAGNKIESDTNHDHLMGPGLPHGPHPIKVPVRKHREDLTSIGEQWIGACFISSLSHVSSLAEALNEKEAQVAGLPDRSPLVSEGVISPQPSNGILMYPQKDYTTGYTPTNDTLALSPSDLQFDYSVCLGDREYIRAFHVEGGEGQSRIVFTFKGIQLSDFNRQGSLLGSRKMAILIKVPGLTTWMDLGRKDGDGPSKQDAFKDGAGCQVIGVKTKNLEPSIEDGIVSCQVEAHVGPAASLFAGFYRTNSERYEVPILMKVILKQSPDSKPWIGSKDMNFEQGGPQGACGDLRGLIQINARFDG